MFTKKKKTSNKNKDSKKNSKNDSKVGPASFSVSAYDHVAVDKPLPTTAVYHHNYPIMTKTEPKKESYHPTTMNQQTRNNHHDGKKPSSLLIQQVVTTTSTTKPPVMDPSLTNKDDFCVPTYNDHFVTTIAPNDDIKQEINNHNTPTPTPTPTPTTPTIKENITILPTIETIPVANHQNPFKNDDDDDDNKCRISPTKKIEVEEVSNLKTTNETTDKNNSPQSPSVEDSVSILSIEENVPRKETLVQEKTNDSQTVEKDGKMTEKKEEEDNKERMTDRTPSIRAPPEQPIASTIGQVPVYTIPGEEGYFPTGRKDEYLVRSSTSTRIYHFDPVGGSIDTASGKLMAEGPLTLRDPSPGIPEEVVLIGECGEILFYLRKDDATVKLSNDDFIFFLPDDECIGINLNSKENEKVKLHVEGLLAYRTMFSEDLKKEEEFADKKTSTMVLMSQWLADKIVKSSEYGAEKIEWYGKHKRSQITETKEKKISSSTMKTAKVTKKVAKNTNKVVTKVSDSISGVIGSAISNAVTPKVTDSKTKERGRSLLYATTTSVCEVLNGISEGTGILGTSMKQESTAYVEAKYGTEAGELARHTAGATVHFTKAVLVSRRIISPKSIMKSGVKEAAKQTIQKTNENTQKSLDKASTTQS